MSDYETHIGKLVEIKTHLSPEEFAEKLLKTELGLELPPYHKTYIDFLRYEYSDSYAIIKNKIYKDILNEDQFSILNSLYTEITQAISGELSCNLGSLQGAAGVGKTYLLSVLIKELNTKHKVRITAPTHKAVGVLKTKLKELKSLNSNTTVSTIHSYLKLKLQNNLDNGLVELVENAFEKDKSKNVDLLIIDESSMISQQLYDYILKKLDNGEVKYVLLSGDVFQLEPVDNTSEAMPVIDVHNKLVLNKVVRQAEGSEIIQQAQFLKQCIENDNYLPLNQLFTQCQTDIISLQDPRLFVNTYLQDSIEDKVILSFTNDSVNKYNTGIRKTIKGDVPQFIIGDELVFNEAYNPDNSDFPVYSNNDIITVGEAILEYHEVYKINYWTIKACIQKEDIDEVNNSDKLDTITLSDNDIFVVDTGSLEYYNWYLQQLAGKAKVSNGLDKKKLWAEYFELKNRYANVAYTYSCTIHKSQGSSYKEVFLNMKGLESASTYLSMEKIYRLLYVGITRTSGKCYLLRN